MLFPRIIALSEIAWTPQAKRNYADFRRRATPYSDALPARGIKAYPLHGITTDVRASKDRKQVTLTLRPERADVQMRYTTDGSTPTASSRLYRQALSTADSLNVKIGLFKGEQPLYTEPIALRLDRHLAMDAKITYACAWNAKYPAGGERTLIDGTRGTPTYLDGLWQGFTEPMDVTIDLGKVCRIGHIYSVFLQEREQWVYMPREVEVFISRDGKNYESLGIRRPSTSEMNPRPVQEQMDWFTSSEARFIRMKATIGRSAGHFIFTDEIVVQ